DGFVLNDADVTVGAARGLGFVVRTAECRDYALALDGAGLRLFVQGFDHAGEVLTAASPVRFSGGNAVWNATARWFESTAELSDGNLNRLQSIRLDPSIAFAI